MIQKMLIAKSFLGLLMGFFLGLTANAFPSPHSRASQSELLQSFGRSTWLSEISSDRKVDLKWTANNCLKWKMRFEALSPTTSRWEAAIAEGHDFIRGEIEDSATMELLQSFLNFSLLKCELAVNPVCATAPGDETCGHEILTWFNYVADLTYDESTIVGLRYARVVRSIWLDEMERLQTTAPQILLSLQEISKSLRSPWPMDRIFLEASRQFKNGQSQKLFFRLAQMFQKNPYQSMDEMLKKVPKVLRLGAGHDLEFAKKMWSDEDLSALRLEVHRVTALQIRTAQAVYLNKFKKTAVDFNDLMKAHLLEQIPIDYLTGAPWVYSAN